MATPTSASALEPVVRLLSRRVGKLTFSEPVTHVYNPLEYAWAPHREYLRRYARRGVEAMFLGMNPGPYGMAQTGVPFGEVEWVRDWMGIEAKVGKPSPEHPKRAIDGFGCARSEVSGRRLWGWAAQRFGTPARFFARFFVYNYCPLVFMEESGRNRTPDKLPESEREPLYEACDAGLVDVVRTLKPRRIIGVGVFAESRASKVLAEFDLPIGRILHPSPASPLANRGWDVEAEKGLRSQGIELD